MKTLYISDLDGTLLNSHAELSDYTIKTLNHLITNGVHFSVATARTAATTLQMFKNVAINIPIVLMNGVLIYDPDSKEYIKKETLSNAVVANIIHAMREAKQTGLKAYTIKVGCINLPLLHCNRLICNDLKLLCRERSIFFIRQADTCHATFKKRETAFHSSKIAAVSTRNTKGATGKV